jgi:hypothetical protein
MGALGQVNKGVLLLAYAIFVVVGGGTIGVGIYYASQVPDSSSTMAVAVAGIGICMMLVGVLACFALLKNMWLVLAIVWFLDLALFIALIISSILGVILGMDVRDPTRTAVDNAFARPDFLASHWDSLYCQDLAQGTYTDSDRCSMTADTGFGKLAADKIAGAGDAWDLEHYGTRDIFGNCSTAFTGCHLVGNSTECVAMFPDADSNPEGDEALGNACLDCKHACREGLIDTVNSSLQPGAIVLFITFVLTAIGISADRWVASTKPEGGMGQMIGFAVNAFIALLGLVMSIIVAIGYHTIQESCPEHADCVNSAVYIVVFLGMFMFVLGLFGVLFTKLEIAPCLKCLSIVHCVIALGLLVSAIFVGIVAGQMETVNAQSEQNFPHLLRAYEQPTMGGPDFCRQAKLNGDGDIIPASDLPAGGQYVMDPCYSTGTAGTLAASCEGESSEVLSCTGEANALAYLHATRPDAYESPVCDTDPLTDAWEVGHYGGAGPGAECPIGCTKVTTTCEFTSGECPAGCDNLAERPATCPANLLLSQESSCPQTADVMNGDGCTWDPTRYAEDKVRCLEGDNRCPVYLPVSQEECRLRIKVAIEGNLTVIGIISAVLAAGLFVIMYLTWVMQANMRSGGGDGGSWEGDE